MRAFATRRLHAGFALALLPLLSLVVMMAGGCGVAAVDPGRPGFPCNQDGSCRNGLICVDGSCARPGTLLDAGPDAGRDAGDDAGTLDAGEDGGPADSGPGDGGISDAGGDGGADGGPSCVNTGVTACLACADGTGCFDGSVTGVCRAQACFEGCLVSGVAYPTGASMSGNTCQVCDPATDPTGFSNVSDGLACTDDANPCTRDLCQGGACLHPPVADSDPCPDDQNPCTDDLCASGSCAHPNAPQGTACGGTGQCDATGACSAGCDIGANRYNAGDENQANSCAFCDPVTSSTAWTAKVDGAACAGDSNACTADLCAGGVCDHPPLSTGNPCAAGLCDGTGACAAGCAIGGIFFPAGATKQSNPCEQCDPARSTTGWSPVGNGLTCPGDGNPCTDDLCSTGACTHPATAAGSSCTGGQVCDGSGGCVNACFIAGALYPAGTPNPASPCESCDPSISAIAWTARRTAPTATTATSATA